MLPSGEVATAQLYTKGADYDSLARVTFDLRPCTLDDVRALCIAHHGYASAGSVAVYTFGVYEDERIVAAYAWQPPPPGAAVSVCPEAPSAVLALSRMVAVPRAERRLKHVSKPLRVQMKCLIDRTRWPVLVTYSDEGQGHTGYVYACSGWTPTIKRAVPTRVDAAGARVSRYANGTTQPRDGHTVGAPTTIQRWEHRACPAGTTDAFMAQHGWRREPSGRRLRSGAIAYRWVRESIS